MDSNLASVQKQNHVKERKKAKAKDHFWKDEKFQELLLEVGEVIEENKTEYINGLMIGNIFLSKKKLSEVIYISIKIYGGLYSAQMPSYAQKYPNESIIEFMKRWDKIIMNLEKYRDILNGKEEKILIVWS